MRVVFCGFGRAALECFYQLITNYDVNSKNITVFTHDVKGNEDFIKHLKDNNINFTFSKINECEGELIKFSPDYLISIYYRYIIDKKILKLVEYKAMNSHPSLLPLYRGTKSSVWAILNNENETGITFHYINEKIDDGNILFQTKLKIKNDDTAYSLYHKLITLFSSNFCIAFDKLIKKDIGYQQVGASTYYNRQLPFNGIMSFENTTYNTAKLFVRAMYFPPFKGAIFINNNDEQIEINNIDSLFFYKNKFKK
jgi:methionyl-tRNA formyltransferase